MGSFWGYILEFFGFGQVAGSRPRPAAKQGSRAAPPRGDASLPGAASPVPSAADPPGP